MKQVRKLASVARTRHAAEMDQGDGVEAASERVARLYRSEGGALVGWLVDDARRRGIALKEMAEEVGVTVGYISQLRAGKRPVENISKEFARSCAEFLGVAPVVVMLVAGCIRSSDFSPPNVGEGELLDRTLQAALADPRLRGAVPEDLLVLAPDAKRALALMYSALSGQDLIGFSQLPESVRWLRRAAARHDDNALDASAVPQGSEVVTHRQLRQL